MSEVRDSIALKPHGGGAWAAIFGGTASRAFWVWLVLEKDEGEDLITIGHTCLRLSV